MTKTLGNDCIRTKFNISKVLLEVFTILLDLITFFIHPVVKHIFRKSQSFNLNFYGLSIQIN